MSVSETSWIKRCTCPYSKNGHRVLDFLYADQPSRRNAVCVLSLLFLANTLVRQAAEAQLLFPCFTLRFTLCFIFRWCCVLLPPENSRRQKLSQKHNIEKKVREHRRKMRKTAKQTGGPVRKKHRRDPGIPNSCPFKQDILRTIQIRKQQKEAQIAAERERRHAEASGALAGGLPSKDDADEMDAPELVAANQLEQLLDSAADNQSRFLAEQQRQNEFVDGSLFSYELTTQQQVYLQQQQRQQQLLLRRVLQQADVIIEVLDARMPSAFRCPALERWVLGEGKKLILVMNKIDLVPKEAAVAWLKTLQRGVAPALAFKCAGGRSSGARKRGVKRGGKRKLQNWTDVEPLEASESFKKCSSVALGAPALLRLLNALAHTANRGEGGPPLLASLEADAASAASSSSAKANLIVGVVGYPNVGKSSIVNALTHSCSTAAVAAMPGSTKTLQFVRVDKHIQLIDSPGVLFSPSKNPQDDALLLPPSTPGAAAAASLADEPGRDAAAESCSSFILRSLLPVHRLGNPQQVASAVAAWCCPETLQRLYRLEAFSLPQEMLALLAHRRGKLKKGGVPDLEAAAKIFLQDWQTGGIPYYTLPPSESAEVSAAPELKGEKVAFWKSAGGEGSGDAKAQASPADVYASVLAAQCRAIETGEDEEKKTDSGDAQATAARNTGVLRISHSAGQRAAEPQRPFMLLRFGPVPGDSASTGEEAESGDDAMAEDEAPERLQSAAKVPKKAAKKKRKLANKLHRQAAAAARGTGEEAYMDVSACDML
ncbi:GNL3L/Grn1 GTPase [Besnoitia besnoiti]|uniref:GNL3L/Grn1 GTPase n=1 Tax=Besnoitia besnoiti TaxID=94643 RepID=A0A2A9ME44_BESBE|nr:GNL3L/Grn1 GTPase [Besnoitia besnoiti]PFH34541.1 GNL3L/Grn1 GTPase [Besnoitia besnoiti]